MKLFGEMPYLENDRLYMREMQEGDAKDLEAIAKDRAVYIYLPTFLYEQKYDDASEVIQRMRKECFETRESILLGVFLKENPEHMIGIGEIYAYDEAKNKASLGVRLAKEAWHKGIACEVVSLLLGYLVDVVEIRTVTAHVMTHNIASQKITERAGLQKKFFGLWEDWGREGPVLVDKFIWKKPKK
ncbi:MAG: GNAT family N-acetyltransferase [Parasporobacterium sp.]|nr:GNAT family N-acetyltransferase [Parasporobacterium sp.]